LPPSRRISARAAAPISVPRPAMTTYAPSWPCPQQANRTPVSLAMHGSSPSGVRACRHKLHTVRPLSSMTHRFGHRRSASLSSSVVLKSGGCFRDSPESSVAPSASVRSLPRRVRGATGTQSLSQRTCCTRPRAEVGKQRRVRSPPGATRDQGERLRRPLARGGAVSLRPRRELPGGGAARGEHRRRRRSTGQVAGAFYGEAGIPAEWRSRLALPGTIEELADRLHDAARG
jgi:hypothetical protein